MNKIVLLSSSPDGRVVNQLRLLMEKRFMEYAVLSLDDALSVPYAFFDHTIILPRIAPEQNAKGIIALERASLGGATVINTVNSWRTSRDKSLSYDAFLRHSVETPLTVKLSLGSHFQDCADTLGLPFIIKPAAGTHGEGIVLVHKQEDFTPDLGLLAQVYIAESLGRDLRVVVVNGIVIAAMERQAAEGDFRANLHLGAIGRPVKIDRATEVLAVSAATALELDIAGVDIIMSSAGPQVLECNPSPGIIISDVTGINIEDAMIDFIETLSKK
ncbi:MAG: RimK family alpha-L-glutamate ligase [Candidatus Saccharimonadales bacterium]